MTEIEYTTLGRTELEVSRLCIGSWQASGWVTSSDQHFVANLRYALDQGLNFVDTAIAYGKGHSEQLIGAALKGHRERFIIATKFWHKDSSPEKVRESLEKSLINLGTDYVDLFQQHWPSKSVPLEDTLGELERLKEEGKIRVVGVSNWMEPEWEEIEDPSRVEFLQPCYNLLFRSIEPSVLPLCRKHNIAVLPYSPLCQGVLAGKFTTLDNIPNDPRKQNQLLTEEKFPRVGSVLTVLAGVASKYEKTLAQVALRWLLQQEGVTAPIVGFTSQKQINDNLGAFGWSIDEEDMELLSLVSWPLSVDLKPHDSLWGYHSRAN